MSWQCFCGETNPPTAVQCVCGEHKGTVDKENAIEDAREAAQRAGKEAAAAIQMRRSGPQAEVTQMMPAQQSEVQDETVSAGGNVRNSPTYFLPTFCIVVISLIALACEHKPVAGPSATTPLVAGRWARGLSDLAPVWFPNTYGSKSAADKKRLEMLSVDSPEFDDPPGAIIGTNMLGQDMIYIPSCRATMDLHDFRGLQATIRLWFKAGEPDWLISKAGPRALGT